jgi:hypothetical protein
MAATPGGHSGPRSLADDIRGRDDQELRTLILRRPDLARPAPADLTALAARAGTRASIQRSLDSLDLAHLQVLEAAVALGDPVDREALAAALGGEEATARGTAEDVVGPANAVSAGPLGPTDAVGAGPVGPADAVGAGPLGPADAVGGSPVGSIDLADVLDGLLGSLWQSALVWRSPEGLRVVRGVAEALGPHPAGLGPPLAELDRTGTAARLPGPVGIRQLAQEAPQAARAVLDRLAWGPPVGLLGDTAPDEASPAGSVGHAVRWLLDGGLVLDQGHGQVVMPREVGLALRGGRVHRKPRLTPPVPARGHRRVDDIGQAAGGQVSDLLVLVDDLAAAWGPRPPRVLRAGGLSIRDLRQLATRLDVDQQRAAFVAELALAAGLVADDGELEPAWAPTAAFDEWQQLPGAAQWVPLAEGWLASTRAAYLVGTTPPGGSGTVNALGPEAHWPPARALRRDVLGELLRLAEGSAADAADVAEGLRWRRPRRLPPRLEELVGATLTEAEWLGVTGRGALSEAGRALATGVTGEALASTMHPHLAAPVDKVLLQADLTAIAPGPLVGSLAQFMRLVADAESRGGATVYRFRPDTVRRCLDAGWSAEQVLSGLADASQTPVPQPLEYLVRDVARRHGQTRVSSAATVVRSDDPAALEAMAADRALGALQLRSVAPTVLVSPVGAEVVLEMLRDGGYSPVVETASGGIVTVPAAQRRSRARRPAPASVRRLDEDVTTALIAALRAGEESAAYLRAQREARPGPHLPSTDPTTTVAILREAAADRQGVWIGYADREGQVARMLLYPERVEGGRVHGTADGARRTLSIHRITGAAAE